RKLRAFAEEELLGLIEEHLVCLLRPARQPILVHDHLEVLEPHLPCVLGDGLVDALPQLIVPGLEVEARELLPELCTLHHPRHANSRVGDLYNPTPCADVSAGGQAVKRSIAFLPGPGKCYGFQVGRAPRPPPAAAFAAVPPRRRVSRRRDGGGVESRSSSCRGG